MSKCKFMRLTAVFLSVIMLFNTVTMDVLATGSGEMETIKIEETESAESSLKEAESAGSSSQESESPGVIGSMTTEDMFADNASSSVGIIGEDTSKREANMKVFLNEDFTYTAAIYPTAVHYMENGQWKDIVRLHFIPNLTLKLFLNHCLCFFNFILRFRQIVPKNCVYKRTGDFAKKSDMVSIPFSFQNSQTILK